MEPLYQSVSEETQRKRQGETSSPASLLHQKLLTLAFKMPIYAIPLTKYSLPIFLPIGVLDVFLDPRISTFPC